ncbi:site-specific integrase [Xylophilus sp. GOD-11R]|uniref:site-specific integrase n=1 Tax=Xylophilus sp. GOD-11R TaxID=3089814 RepID=UPI00298C7DF6|nr:site-specific integrase [Xylophilus sp. GOD-11R]WPB58735.1 site-specific integrase [Xylophilus sp. GOD-11R]
MAFKIPGTYLRGNRFWLKVLAPKELQARFYGGKRIAFDGTLGTGDPEVARAKAASVRADLEAQFLRQRRELSPPRLTAVSPELRQYITGVLLATEMARDAQQRIDKTGASRVHRAPTVGYAAEDGTLPEAPEVARISPIKPLAPEVVSYRAKVHLQQQAIVRSHMAAGNLEVMIPILRPLVKRMGLEIDYESQDGVQLLQEALETYSGVKDSVVQKDEGMVVATPALPSPPQALQEVTEAPKTDGQYLRDIKAEWLAIKPRTGPASRIMDRALRLMADAGVNLPLAEITRQHGATLRAYLVATGIKGQSVKNLFVPLQSLLNVAVDAGKLQANPWAGLRIDTSDSVQRLPWRSEDLNKLAEANRLRTDAGRWLLPLALYTGCRAGEMAQAELEDIRQIDGIWCLEVHSRPSESNPHRSVKTKAGERLIPISQHLVDLGFLTYVNSAKKSGGRFVFPEFIGEGKRIPSDFASADFLKLREIAGVEIDERFTLHSIRHNVRSALAAAHVNDQIIDKLVGHESGTVQGRYTHATTFTLSQAVAKLDWTVLLLG